MNDNGQAGSVQIIKRKSLRVCRLERMECVCNHMLSIHDHVFSNGWVMKERLRMEEKTRSLSLGSNWLLTVQYHFNYYTCKEE